MDDFLTSLKPWMGIGATTFLVAMAANILRPKDIKWFRQLTRPRWLTFEKLIPLIWTIVFVCGAWSAYIVWKHDPGTSQTWAWMAFYLLLEIVTVTFSPALLWSRSLKLGTFVGGTGFVVALILAIAVLSVSVWASLLLLPYLLWSPVGTYTTWKMKQLNPGDA